MRRNDLVHAVRQRLRRYPEPYASHYGVIPSPPPELGIELGPVAARYQQASEAFGRIDALSAELPDLFIISRILRRREAISSSAIEGTNSTLDELLSAEETRNEDAHGDAIQVRDYATALEELIPRAQEDGPDLFTLELVRNLHRAVVKGDAGYPNEPGALRSAVVWIGGTGNIAYSTYNPAPPNEIERTLSDTLAYMRGNGPQILSQPLIVRMAIAHAHFEAVHPFRDGNGRVGRLLLPLMMAAEDHVPLYVSPYIETHKDAYYAALRAAQQRLDWPAIIGFLSDAIAGSLDELMATRRALAALQALWQKRCTLRSRSAASRALALLPYYPVLRIGRLAELLDVTFRAASTGIDQLVASGILVERTGYRRNRLFSAPEVLSILNRPFGADPVLPER